MYEAGMRLVIDDERSMFHGEIATVCATASPYPASTVHVKIEGWPSMSWPTSSVRPATQTDLDRAVIWSYCPHISQLDRMGGLRCPDCGPTLRSYAPIYGPEGGSAPQMTGPTLIARLRGAWRRSVARLRGSASSAYDTEAGA